MFANLQDIDEKLHMLERQLSDPELVSDQQRYREVVREHSLVAKLAELQGEKSYAQQWQEIAAEIKKSDLIR